MPDILEMLERLLNVAITEGRTNWDSYYGHDNSYHLPQVKENEAYLEFIAALKDRDAL